MTTKFKNYLVNLCLSKRSEDPEEGGAGAVRRSRYRAYASS